MNVSETNCARFQEDGAILLRGAFRDRVMRLRAGAAADGSPIPRRLFSSRRIGEDALFADRGRRPSPPFPGLNLRDGQPLDAPEFPIAYRS